MTVHQHQGQTAPYYFLPTDTQKKPGNGAGDGSNLLDWEAIERALTKGGGKHILFVDSCHSGGAYNTTLRQDAEHQGFVYFVATAATSATGSPPLAKEDSNLGHGYFTFAAIEGLKGKAEDQYDRTIRVTDLGPYIVKDVRRRSVNGQEPDYYSALGDIILVRH